MKINKIYNEDCLIGMQHIPDKTIDAIVTDPPYKYLNHKLDRDFDEDAVFRQFDRILKPEGFIVIFGRGMPFYLWNIKLEELGFKFKEEVVWDKRHFSSPFLPLGRIHENASLLTKKGKVRARRTPYLESKGVDLERIQTDLKRLKSVIKNLDEKNIIENYLRTGNISAVTVKGKSKHGLIGEKTAEIPRNLNVVRGFVEGKKETDIISVQKEQYSYVHPTQKPVRLMERLINLVSNKNDLILDPFAGSGSTLLAALNINRNFIGFEIDKDYYDKAIERINNHQLQISLF